MSKHTHTTRTVREATIYTVIYYTDGAEVREYTVHGNDELADLLMEMRDPKHGEWVFDTDVTYAEEADPDE